MQSCFKGGKKGETSSAGRCIFKHQDGSSHAEAFAIYAEVGSKKQKIYDADRGLVALIQHLNNGVCRGQVYRRVDTWR
jgi:hypothetical protein